MSNIIQFKSGGGGGGGITSITGDTGGALTNSNINIITNLAFDGAGATVSFDGTGNTNLTLHVTDTNANTLIGQRSGGFALAGGYENTALGRFSAASLTTGYENVAVGAVAGTGGGATTLGALQDGNNNIAIGASALGRLVSGTDNIVVGSQKAGYNFTSTESYNIILGECLGTNGESQVMRLGNDGTIGSATLNTYIAACYSNPGTNNTFVGALSGNLTLSGDHNTAVGYNAQTGITSGTYNVAIGALAQNAGALSGSLNVAIGGNAQPNISSGTRNMSMGTSAHGNLTTGTNNVAMGDAAMDGIFTGSYNVAIGSSAGNNCITGAESSNIYINSPGGNNESNTLRIGNGSGTGNQQLAAAFINGISGVTVTGAAVLCATDGQLGTISSSRVLKENIQEMGSFSESIYKLKPVTFTFKANPEMGQHWGLIAEEVHDDMPDLCLYDEDNQPASVKYHDLPALLLNEIQKLRKEVNELKARLA